MTNQPTTPPPDHKAVYQWMLANRWEYHAPVYSAEGSYTKVGYAVLTQGTAAEMYRMADRRVEEARKTIPPLGMIDILDKWVHEQTRFHQPDTDNYNAMLAQLAMWPASELRRMKKQTASNIFSLAHEYAQNDKTMVGSEELRAYHYYNAISKIGEFDGR